MGAGGRGAIALLARWGPPCSAALPRYITEQSFYRFFFFTWHADRKEKQASQEARDRRGPSAALPSAPEVVARSMVIFSAEEVLDGIL